MKVLISNDDGIHALGIRTLVETLAEKFEVYVVAPDRERSATGHALTLHEPVRVYEINMGSNIAKAFAVSGTPSDCVKLALNALLDVKPDIVVSGINHGPNLGADVLYSGTVSAALEGAINGLPSVAISQANGYDKTADFSPGAQFMADFLPRVAQMNLPPKTILNVNVPPVPLEQMRGIKPTVLGTRMYSDTYEKRMDPRNQVYYWLAGEVVDEGEEEGSDVVALKEHFISVTPVQFDMTNYAFLKTHRHLLEVSGHVLDFPVSRSSELPPAV